MRPSVSLVVGQPSPLREEPWVFSLLLSNPSSEDQDVPLPREAWWQAARLQLTRPDGTVTSFDLMPAPSPSSEGPLVLLEDAELAHSFSLGGRVPVLESPGLYQLGGVLASREGDWEIEPVMWWVEEPRPFLAAVANGAQPLDQAPRVWSIARGESRAALAVRTLSFDDNEGDVLVVSSPHTLLDVEPATSSIAAAIVADEGGPCWLAWLADETLHVGFGTSSAVRATSHPVPEAAELLRPVVLRPDGRAVIFLREAGTQITPLVLSPPVPVEPSSDEDDEDDENDDFPPPSAYWRFPPVEAESPFVAAERALFGAASGAGGTIVALASQSGASIEVAVARLTSEPPRWTTARVAEAQLVPGAPPSVAVGEDGVTRIGVLYEKLGEQGSPSLLGAAVLAFDAEGFPLWRAEPDAPPVPSPAGSPATGAVELWWDPRARTWKTSFCALFDDGSCLLRHGHRPPSHQRPDGELVVPVTLAVFADACAVPCSSRAGRLSFVRAA